MKDKLITKNYIEILAANFLLFFGFWLLMPVLPFYLAEVFDANKTTIGAVLSCYTIAALCRPFATAFAACMQASVRLCKQTLSVWPCWGI